MWRRIVMSYSRSYENISFKYSLPSHMWHPSFILEKYVEKISSEYDISPEEVIDAYVEIYIQDLEKNVTKMIRHDGNKLLNESYAYTDCIIDKVRMNSFVKSILENRKRKKLGENNNE